MVRYTFKVAPWFSYRATFRADKVILVCFFHVVILSSEEFNGLLWVGQLNRDS